MKIASLDDCIVAIATPPGVGAIGVIRLSGNESIALCQSVFKGADLTTVPSHTVHFGYIVDGKRELDEVLVTIFKGKKSYTKQESVEIACHGSPYILQEVVKVLIQKGARLAEPGEFTKRAFLNGRFNLAQAEAVADLIASDSAKSHEAAMQLMRGGFTNEIKALREELIQFLSLIELELDFAEEDVEFANRAQLNQLLHKITQVVGRLAESFQWGNVLKKGVQTVIVGSPNAGKSTLLNTLLNEEKAIVSDIPGTTRDFIEDHLTIDGILFRFVDTAGLREATDQIEAQGIERTKQKMASAALVIYLFDALVTTQAQLEETVHELENQKIPFVLVANKTDQAPISNATISKYPILSISAKEKTGIDKLKEHLVRSVISQEATQQDHVVTNLRHYEALRLALEQLDQVNKSLHSQASGEMVSFDLREVLDTLGTITGEVDNEDVLTAIFSQFCIGK